jgi:hypothetical protein
MREVLNALRTFDQTPWAMHTQPYTLPKAEFWGSKTVSRSKVLTSTLLRTGVSN